MFTCSPGSLMWFSRHRNPAKNLMESHFWSLARYRIGTRFLGLDYAGNVIFYRAYRKQSFGGWAAVTLGAPGAAGIFNSDTTAANVLEDGYPMHYKASQRLQRFVMKEKSAWEKAKLAKPDAGAAGKEAAFVADDYDSDQRFRDVLILKCSHPKFFSQTLRLSPLTTTIYKCCYFYLWLVVIAFIFQGYLSFRNWVNPPARKGLMNLEEHALHIPRLLFAAFIKGVAWAVRKGQPVIDPVVELLDAQFPGHNWSSKTAEDLAVRADEIAGKAHPDGKKKELQLQQERDRARGKMRSWWMMFFSFLIVINILLCMGGRREGEGAYTAQQRVVQEGRRNNSLNDLNDDSFRFVSNERQNTPVVRIYSSISARSDCCPCMEAILLLFHSPYPGHRFFFIIIIDCLPPYFGAAESPLSKVRDLRLTTPLRSFSPGFTVAQCCPAVRGAVQQPVVVPRALCGPLLPAAPTANLIDRDAHRPLQVLQRSTASFRQAMRSSADVSMGPLQLVPAQPVGHGAVPGSPAERYGDRLLQVSCRWSAKFYGQVTFGPRGFAYPSSRWLARRFRMKKHKILKRFRFRRYKLAAVANLPFAKMIRVGMLPELKSSKSRKGDVVDAGLSSQLVSQARSSTGGKTKGRRSRPKSKYQYSSGRSRTTTATTASYPAASLTRVQATLHLSHAPPFSIPYRHALETVDASGAAQPLAESSPIPDGDTCGPAPLISWAGHTTLPTLQHLRRAAASWRKASVGLRFSGALSSLEGHVPGACPAWGPAAVCRNRLGRIATGTALSSLPLLEQFFIVWCTLHALATLREVGEAVPAVEVQAQLVQWLERDALPTLRGVTTWMEQREVSGAGPGAVDVAVGLSPAQQRNVLHLTLHLIGDAFGSASKPSAGLRLLLSDLAGAAAVLGASGVAPGPVPPSAPLSRFSWHYVTAMVQGSSDGVHSAAELHQRLSLVAQSSTLT
eukprot:gene10480-7285_t